MWGWERGDEGKGGACLTRTAAAAQKAAHHSLGCTISTCCTSIVMHCWQAQLSHLPRRADALCGGDGLQAADHGLLPQRLEPELGAARRQRVDDAAEHGAVEAEGGRRAGRESRGGGKAVGQWEQQQQWRKGAMQGRKRRESTRTTRPVRRTTAPLTGTRSCR